MDYKLIRYSNDCERYMRLFLEVSKPSLAPSHIRVSMNQQLPESTIPIDILLPGGHTLSFGCSIGV